MRSLDCLTLRQEVKPRRAQRNEIAPKRLIDSPLKMDLVGRNELGEFRQRMISRRKIPELRRYGSLLPAYDSSNRVPSWFQNFAMQYQTCLICFLQ